MPNDIQRPLAQTTSSDIVIIASRMGLRWWTLESEIPRFQADGCGYAMNAIEFRGIGMVLRHFTTTGTSEALPDIVPSVAVDKLMCRIIPGDPLLVDVQDSRTHNKRMRAPRIPAQNLAQKILPHRP